MAFTYSPLASYTVPAGGVSVITFTNIPQNYTDLVLKISIRDTTAAIQNNVIFKMNGVTTSQSQRWLLGQGSGTPTSSADTPIYSPAAVGANATANTFSNAELYISNYASSANKSVSIDAVNENNGTTGWQQLTAGLYASSNPITSIILAPNGSASFVQYSTATLYGIRATEY